MKITNLVERIFANAVALNQSGGLRNTIYAIEDKVFILNYDHTVLMRFRLRASEGKFDTPLSFKADDYDSNEFDLVDGKVVFTSSNGPYTRKKTAGTGELEPEVVAELYANYMSEVHTRKADTVLGIEVLELLDSNLSHIEFSGQKGGKVKMLQRNIYSGGIIEVTESGNDLLETNVLQKDFGPVALNTQNFAAMFHFDEKSIKLGFPSRDKEDFITIEGTRFTAIAALSLYDEIIEIQEARNHGRQEQKIRRSK